MGASEHLGGKKNLLESLQRKEGYENAVTGICIRGSKKREEERDDREPEGRRKQQRDAQLARLG